MVEYFVSSFLLNKLIKQFVILKVKNMFFLCNIVKYINVIFVFTCMKPKLIELEYLIEENSNTIGHIMRNRDKYSLSYRAKYKAEED